MKRVGTPEAAEIMGMTPQQVRNLIDCGELEAINIAANERGPTCMRVSMESIKEFVARRTTKKEGNTANEENTANTANRD